MPTSTKMFVEQSHLPMSSSVWLHINGVSLATDMHQYQPPVHSYDYRTKHLQSPVQPPTPPLISSPTVAPYSITMIDGPFNNNNNTHTTKQHQKLENTDLPKKFFIDRQIKKAKSLPGLIKGTALSRHTPSTFPSPALVNPSTHTVQDDQLPIITSDNDESLPLPPPPIEHHNEVRRPRVYFADYNKVQFIEDNNEINQRYQLPVNSTHRRHRHRTSKKTSNTNMINSTTPSIQQPQILQNGSRPLSRQLNAPIGQELSIKKQQILNCSPRVYSSRTAHLPDILNQSLPNESSSNEISNGKYVLQREKPFIRLPRPAHDMPINSPLDISSDNTHNDTNHFQTVKDFQETELVDNSNGTLLQGSSSISSNSTNRHRPSLRTISLRQQFIGPFKLKSTGITPTTNPNHQQQMTNSILNARRSASLKQSTARMHNDKDDLHHNASLLTIENRPVTGASSVRKLKRSYVIHFNSKNPTNDLNKSHFHESTQDRFENLLTIVRPPYATNNSTTSNTPSLIPNDPTIPTINHPNGNGRSSRHTSAHGPLEYQLTSNTIAV